MKIERPVFIVGPPRSGTTMLGRIFAVHSEVAFWDEPRTIWEIGNSFGRSDDRLTEADLDSEIAGKIRARFERFLKKSGRNRFAEKTPTNVLRIPFLVAAFPDCRIVFVSRSGPASVASVLKMRKKPPRLSRLWTRLTETPITGIPALLMRLFNRRRFLLRPPGWQSFSDNPIPEAVQRWKAADEIARQDLENLPGDSWIEVSYESLVKEPRAHLKEIFEFCDLEASDSVFDFADSMIDPARAHPEIPEEIIKAFHEPTGSV